MERRVFLAILLSFVVFYGYQTLFVPPPPPGNTPAAGQPAPGANPAPPAAAPPETTAAPPVPENQPAAITGDSSEREVTVETATVEAVL